MKGTSSINLKIFGAPTSEREYLKMMLLKQAEKAKVKLNIEEVVNVETLIEEKIESIPSIQVNGDRIIQRKGLKLNDFINQVSAEIFEQVNYGSMKKIVVPTDFSATADNALSYAIEIAKKLNGTVRLIHAFRPNSASIDGSAILDEELEKLRRAQFEDYINSVNDNWIGDTNENPSISGDFIVGFPSTEIGKCAEALENGLIIMGSTGSTGSLKNYLGSVSTDVVNNSTSPVLLVPRSCEYNPIKRIAVAVATGELSAKSLNELVSFAKVFNAEITLVHIAKNGDDYPEQDMLDLWRKAYDSSMVKSIIIEDDNKIHGINEFVVNQEIDLLVATTKKRSFFADLFHKSVTRSLAINSKTPLLVLHNH